MFGQSSRERLQIGINKVADAVGVTLGPRGLLSPWVLPVDLPGPSSLVTASVSRTPSMLDVAFTGGFIVATAPVCIQTSCSQNAVHSMLH